MKATTKFGFENTKFGFRIYTSKIVNLISKNFIIMLIFILWSLVNWAWFFFCIFKIWHKTTKEKNKSFTIISLFNIFLKERIEHVILQWILKTFRASRKENILVTLISFNFRGWFIWFIKVEELLKFIVLI